MLCIHFITKSLQSKLLLSVFCCLLVLAKSIVPLWVKSGTLRFPSTLNTSVILVGPGTGCAIFRSFLYDRRSKRQELKENTDFGKLFNESFDLNILFQIKLRTESF
jgi:sulfite reductase alpha subunit-like flavoprotein